MTYLKQKIVRLISVRVYKAITTGKNAKSETIARPHGAPVDIQYEGSR